MQRLIAYLTKIESVLTSRRLWLIATPVIVLILTFAPDVIDYVFEDSFDAIRELPVDQQANALVAHIVSVLVIVMTSAVAVLTAVIKLLNSWEARPPSALDVINDMAELAIEVGENIQETIIKLNGTTLNIPLEAVEEIVNAMGGVPEVTEIK